MTDPIAHGARSTRPVIALDAMGGDHGLDVTLEAAAEVSLDTECVVALVGDERDIRDRMKRLRHDSQRIRIEPSEGAIGMGASPREALAALPGASLPVATRLVARGGLDGGADALVSAGNTGAVILACAESFTRIQGVSRSALAAVVPTERRRGEKSDPFSLLLDCGATVRVRARDLVTFALMGASYAAIISKNQRPRVALLSNGSEPTKGTDEIVEAHRILAGLRSIDFIGNVEGVDIPRGTADVVVCDGFTGNVVLKMLEGVSETVRDLARFAYRSKLAWKVAMMLLATGLKQIKTLTDWQQYGGAPLLGFDRICIKAHGRSGPRAIRNALKVAARCVRQDLSGSIGGNMAELESAEVARLS